MSYEPSARELVASEMAKREAMFAPWWTIDDAPEPASPEAVAILEKAREFGWSGPVEGDTDDESPEEFAETQLDSARAYLRDKRDDEDAMDEDVLDVSVAVTVTLRVNLSTGGPGDYLTADLDPTDGTVSNVAYHFVPWFDHASVPVERGSHLYALAERFADGYAGQSLTDIAERS